MPVAVDRLVVHLQRLPGVGRRGALRFAVHLANSLDLAQALGDALRQLGDDVALCRWCGGLADARGPNASSNGVLCTLCANPRRETGLLCVVAKYPDMLALELSGAMRGRYFILGTLVSPLAGTDAEDLPVERLRAVVDEQTVTEVILATPPSVDGEATALVLRGVIEAIGGVKITRIASGVAHGAELDFADAATLALALQNRRDV